MLMRKPQLAKDYAERFLPEFPLLVQPKLDGVRCIVNTDLSCWCKPRTGKDLVQHKPHIARLLGSVIDTKMMEELGGCLDGELFVPGMYFEDIVSGVKAETSEYARAIKYYIFDFMHEEMTFNSRYSKLLWWHSKCCRTVPFFQDMVFIVPAKYAHDMADLKTLHAHNDKHYEGSIIRNPMSCYAFGKRNRDLMRWKMFKDAEYVVKDIVDGKGKNVGISTFVCVTRSGKEFRADSTGSREQRMKWFTDRDKIIGKEVTVSFQNISKYGIPRFPKVKAVRDYE